MKNKLQLEQLDRKIRSFNRVSLIGQPKEGWIRSIRISLGMSLSQLAKKVSISVPTLAEIEKRELEGVVNLGTLDKIAKSLGLKLVYGFSAPKNSLNKMVKKQAYKVATEIVSKTDKNMKLENQATSRSRIKKAIKERAEEIVDKQEKCLWD